MLKVCRQIVLNLQNTSIVLSKYPKICSHISNEIVSSRSLLASYLRFAIFENYFRTFFTMMEAVYMVTVNYNGTTFRRFYSDEVKATLRIQDLLR